MEGKNERTNNNFVGDTESDYSFGTYGLVLKSPIDAMPIVLNKLKEIPGVKIIYQRKSVGPLRIVNAEP